MRGRPKFTEQHRLFAQEYLVTLNATQAARRAGYKNPSAMGCRILAYPHVKAYVQEQMDERAAELKIDAAFVLSELLRNYKMVMADVKPKRNAKTGKPITDDDGNPVFVHNVTAALKCLELMGKHTKVDAWAGDKVALNVKGLSLEERLHRGRAQAGLMKIEQQPLDAEYTELTNGERGLIDG